MTIGGFSLSSAASSGTSRTVELEQVSINNIARIEVYHSPTPESPGSALAGGVNMVPRGAFERSKPVLNWSTYWMFRDAEKELKKTPGPTRDETYKIHPGFDFSWVVPVNKRFGFTLSAGLNRQYSGERQIQNLWRGTQNPTNGTTFPHTTPDQPYLWSTIIRNSGKDTNRSSFGVTADYKFTPRDRIALSFTYSTFDVRINHNELTFDVGRVNPGDFSLDFTRGAAGQGTLQLATTGNTRSNWTVMPSLVWRGAFGCQGDWMLISDSGRSRCRREFSTDSCGSPVAR